MEILIEGKSKAYSKLPSWFEFTVKELCSKQLQYVLVVYKLKNKPNGSYDIYNHRSKTILRVIKKTSSVLLESIKQKPPTKNSPFVPVWDIVNSQTIKFDPLAYKSLCEAVVKMILTDVCVQTHYWFSYRQPDLKNKVGSYPTEQDPLYGGRIVSHEIENDFYEVTFDNANQHHIPKHLGDRLVFTPGSYLVMNQHHINVINAGVFFDYFCLH